MISLDLLVPPAADVAVHVPGFDACDAVFLSGSLIAGFGHANSDVDVFACASSREELERALDHPDVFREPESGNSIAVFYIGDRRWDVEYLLVEDVEHLIAEVERTELDQVSLSHPDVDLLYRTSIGVPISGETIVKGWQERIRASKIGEILTGRAQTFADGMVDDALGLLEVGDLATAAYCARLAFEGMVDALLASSGRYCPSSKWRIAQLRLEPAGVVDVSEYLEINQMSGYDGRRWTEAVVDRVRELAFEL